MSHELSLLVETPGGEERKAFICSPYVVAEDDRLRPAGRLGQCPMAAGFDGCRLVVHSYRGRKTGPGFALLVMYCHDHEKHFTVYPPGHVPYGRVAVAPVDVGGFGIRGEGAWHETLFRGWAGCGSRQDLGARADR